MNLDHSQVNGSISEHLAVAAFLSAGYKVYHQDHDSGASDLLVEKEGVIQRVQVKSFFVRPKAGHRQERKIACLCGTGRVSPNRVRDLRSLIDLFCVVDAETCTVIIFPSSVSPKTSIGLGPAKRIGQQLLPRP